MDVQRNDPVDYSRALRANCLDGDAKFMEALLSAGHTTDAFAGNSPQQAVVRHIHGLLEDLKHTLQELRDERLASETALAEIETARSLLSLDITLTQRKEIITLQDIIRAVSAKRSVKISDIKSSRRQQEIVNARQEFFYLARKLTNKSWPQISMFCGNKDHTTAIHGAKMHKKRMEAANEIAA